jgi:fibrillarin-like rRNA methylase
LVKEARQINPYVVRKDLGIDYRFWNEFHSNFYATVILGARKTKIRKMQYIDWDEM